MYISHANPSNHVLQTGSGYRKSSHTNPDFGISGFRNFRIKNAVILQTICCLLATQRFCLLKKLTYYKTISDIDKHPSIRSILLRHGRETQNEVSDKYKQAINASQFTVTINKTLRRLVPGLRLIFT